ncbi:NACHT domain-containing protein [Microbispora rosea]|uniref:NACHT domain-containing protein n=1 Tax=Microbispora rosea TaxID=58117 RepID=UPI00378E618C
MTDYRLDGLNPRSFEHLVQALCIKAVTETVTPFGDGPDGGREATFDGTTRYGAGRGRWEGYGVLQAKFLQRPTNPTADGKWVLKELKTELAKYKNRANERKMAYYILATNVALTPVADTGSKDKVFTELREFAKNNGLKGVDVWDYDKLRILLDNNEDVRRAYSAWVTPGDVLADLAEALKPQRPDFHRLIVKFLQKEMLTDQFAKLEQAGHSADEAIPLSQVFVDVPVASEPHSDPVEDTGDGEKSRYFADLIIREASLHCRDDDWQVRAEVPSKAAGRHVLIGGPGQGKTTVGQYICQVFRAALLASVSTAAVDHECLTIVRAIQRQWADGRLAVPGARRIPFRVVLSEFAKSLADGQTRGLLEYLTSLFNARTNADLKIFQFEALLAAYPSILILDGLDEVPASTNRSQVLGATKEFWADIAASKVTDSGIDILVIATSRPQGYNEDFSPKFYSHHWMTPLSPAQAIEYGGKLAEVRFSGDTDRVAKVQRRIRRAAENDATARLMRSPLQVTILTLLLDRMGQPPQERWPLFDEYFKLIYQREIERDIPAAAILREYKSNIITVHRQVGLLLQVEGERSGGTDARLTVEQFKDVVEHHLREEGHEGKKLAALTNSIIEAAAHRLVFLVGLELGQVGFEIRSLQEFMAAEGLMAAGDTTTQDRLRAVAGNTNWRNVFLFAAGKCFFDRQYLRDTIHTVCSELNEDPDDKTARLTLAGSELALDVLEEGSVRRQPRWNRMLTRTALRLLDDSSFEWAQRLAELWQSDMSDVFISELRTRIEGGEPRSAQNAWICLTHLSAHADAEFADLLTNLLGSRQIDTDLFRVLLQFGSNVSAPLRSFIGNSALNYSAVFFIDANRPVYVESGNNARREWDYPGAPGWLEPLAEVFHRNRWPRQRTHTASIVDGGPITRISIPSIREPTELDQELSSFPGGDHGWAIIRAYLDFMASPDKGTLANTLREICAISSESISFRIMQRAPWPLREAIMAVRESGRANELANAAQAGVLGDIDDWLAWQKTWFDQGISLKELIEGDIISAGLSNRSWCPVRGLSVDFGRFSGSRIEGNVGGTLIEVASAASPGPGRDFIMRLAATMITQKKFDSMSLDDADCRGFIGQLFGLSWTLGLECLLALSPNALAERDWLTLLVNSLPKKGTPRFFFNHDPRLFDALLQAWLSNPESRDLLVALIFTTDISEPDPSFTVKLANLDVSADSQQVKLARLVGLLRGHYWNETVATQLRELLADYPDAFMVFVEAINMSMGLSIEQEEVALLHLYEASRSCNISPGPVVRLLREQMRARRSTLTNPASWIQLGFPSELSRLIE